MKYFYLLALLWTANGLSAQSFNMTRNSSDTSASCNGTLYDHGGPTGNYFNSSSDYFYINPPGTGTLTITFNSFSTENCCDRVWIYDGQDFSNLVNFYRGSTLPNGGLPITLSSGSAVVRFSSDGSVTSSGFSLSWSAGSNLAPTASFTTSTSNPALKQPVTFISTSLNSGQNIWDFGDGNIAVGDTVSHAYQTSGSFTAKLVANSCSLSDSITTNITVQNAALLSITPDTINGTVACGQNYLDTLYLQNTGGGAAFANLSVASLSDQIHFSAGFETGLSPFVASSSSTFHTGNAVLGNAAIGNGSLSLSGSGSFTNNTEANFSDNKANYFSFYVNASATNSRSYMTIGEEIGFSYYGAIPMEVYFGSFRFYTGGITYTYTISAGTWHHIEFENIDFTAKTFDIYVDGTLVTIGATFDNSFANNFNHIKVYNTSNAPSTNFDQFELKTLGDNSNFVLSSNNVLTTGTVAIPFTVNLSNSTAGLKQYLVNIRTSATGSDSLVTVPVNLNVTGAPAFNADQACIAFDTLFVNQSATDSIWIENTGCDTLSFSSISASSSRYSFGQSSLSIAPNDSALLFITYNASSAGVFNDTLNLNGNLDTLICLSAAASTAPSIALDSANYTVNSYGCNDSIPINLTLYNNGTGTIPLNWSIGASSSLFDDFENGSTPNSAIWSSIGSNAIFNGCYERSGSYALSMNGTNRIAETVLLNISAGDSVAMWAFPGNNGGTGCENPDNGEDVSVQYLLSGSTFWTTVGTIYNYNLAAQRYSFSIPVSGSMQIRLYQPSHSGTNYDNYRIDDFEIISNSAGNFMPSSGSLVSGDSIQTTGYLSTAGLVSGSYSRNILINSNDPFYPDTIINVSLNVFGDPLLMQSAACLAFDTLYSGASQLDSVLVWNDGCDSLHASALNFLGTEFSSPLSSFSLGLNDSLWLPISFNPGATNLGAQLDTLSIISNDSLRTLCLSAYSIGAPSASFNPDSLSINITNCGDSISIPIYLRNTGLSALDYILPQSGSNSNSNGKIKALLLATSSYTTERNNLNSILSSRTDLDYALIYVYNAVDLKAYLDTSDVIILPEMSSTTYASFFSPELKAFANNGGTIIMTYNAASRMNSYDIMPLLGTYSAPGTITVDEPNHPLMAGLPSSGLANLSATLEGQFVNTSNLLRVAGKVSTDRAVVATQPYGDGQAIFIGYDYFQTNSDIIQLMNNAIDWSAALQGPPNFISASPDSGLVAASDSVLINIGINTAGIPNGTYDYILNWNTNDPLNPILALPVHLVINGSAKVAVVDSTCINFSGIRQGATANDTFRVANDGCDTLQITSFTSSNTVFSISNLSLSVLPGDTADLIVNFAPLTVGTFNDTISVTTNDTSFSICLSATSVGAPILDLENDTLAFTLNKCKVIGTKNFKIRNPGQGALTFDMEIGRFRDSSQISYNTFGATTLHNFTGLPNSADSIKLRIIINGDFDSFSERMTLYIDGSYYQVVYDNNRYYQLDTIDLFIVGTQVATFLSDGILDIGLYNTSSVDGLAGSFHRVELEIVQNVNWVSVIGANAGTVNPLDSLNRNFIFNAATLPVGQHISTLVINNNAPGANPTSVPIVFNVISEPEILLSDTCAFFTLTPLGDTTTRNITIYNDGCEPLLISSMTSTSNQFKIYQSTVSIPVGDSLVLDIDFIPTTVSNFAASIFIISNDTNRTICLSGQSGAQPIADFTSSDENICIGEVSFANNSTYFNILFWDFGDGITSNQPNPTHAYSLPGTYTVTLRASNSIGFDTLSKQITVNPLVAKFGVSKDTLQLNDTAFFSDSTAGAVTWIWDFGDATSSTQQNPSHAYSAQGIFTVRLTVIDSRSCSRSVTKQIRVENKISLQERDWLSDYQLYPNPARGSFKLQSPSMDWSDYRFTLVDAQGRIVLDKKGDKNALQEFSTQRLAVGLYRFMIYQDSELIAIEKIVLKD
jgi:PKD repeat protein